MKKTEIYVPIANKKEAKRARIVLESLGELCGFSYSDMVPLTGGLYFNSNVKEWCLAWDFGSHPVKQITLKQLIELLATGSIKAFEIENALENLRKAGEKFSEGYKSMVESFNNDLNKASQNLFNKVQSESSSTPEKIAVRVDNEEEFKEGDYVLVKKATTGCFGAEGKRGKILHISSKSNAGLTEVDDIDYKIEVGNKVWAVKGKFEKINPPLLKSEDAVDLYEGEKYYTVYPLEDYKDKVYERALHPKHNCIIEPHRAKAFKTREAAEKWIEAQKPKEIELPLVTTEDGKDLYERYPFFGVYYSFETKQWVFRKIHALHPNDEVVTQKERAKCFYYKKNAIEFLEKNNPKKIYIDIINQKVNVVVTKDEVYNLDKLEKISLEDVEAIHKAMEELNNG